METHQNAWNFEHLEQEHSNNFNIRIISSFAVIQHKHVISCNITPEVKWKS